MNGDDQTIERSLTPSKMKSQTKSTTRGPTFRYLDPSRVSTSELADCKSSYDRQLVATGQETVRSVQQVTNLVNTGHQDRQIESRSCKESPKRTSFNDTPVEMTTDEGVGSPSNIDYDDDDVEEDEEEVGDEYYEDEEDYETSEQTDELANLSRQSMMPLHELIAYYQYIQKGSYHHGPVSRQTSNSSQKTTRTNHSIDVETFDSKIKSDHSSINKTQCDTNEGEDKLDTAVGPLVNKIQVPELQVDSVNIDESVAEPDQQDLGGDKAISDRRRIRANVILELINSERDFVKHLKDVVVGYLYPARKHPEIFTGDRINTIFSNIEQLYELQRKFLECLEACINWDDLAASEVGNCFLKFESGFSVYHHYCNNHPNATSELQDLYTRPRFVEFFEACRLLQNMIDISLDGFLLTPIQKICKYPLQLNELLKNTEEDHPDRGPVANALESMRNCANVANERKRRIEALADVMYFQEKVDNWFGPKLSDTSSILIHSGEVSKMTSHSWSQGVQLYLFDHLLLYSKKDLLKRNSLILKGRICMDTVTEISDADEYKSKKSFKLFCGEQQKWFVFTTRSEKEKEEWMKAFDRERNLVEADENEGFRITEREIGVARRALQNRKHSRSARYRHKRPDTAIVDQLDLDDANTIMNRTLSLPSCIHPSHVMNFVEDSRVISSGKKNQSPISRSRSPTASNQHLAEQDTHQQSSGGWFRKMGSKKLVKSQVYNVNGNVGSNAPPSSTVENFVTKATTKYDQLEKRHRDHMVSEEHARLHRLNNDLPPPSFLAKTTKAKSPVASHTNRQGVIKAQSQQPGQKLGQIESPSLAELDIKSLSLDGPQPAVAGHCQKIKESGKVDSTIETTVVLSSGRIVRVREDAV